MTFLNRVSEKAMILTAISICLFGIWLFENDSSTLENPNNYSINIRKSPSTNGDIVGKLQPKEKLEILQEYKGWFRTEKGYIYKDVVSIDYKIEKYLYTIVVGIALGILINYGRNRWAIKQFQARRYHPLIEGFVQKIGNHVLPTDDDIKNFQELFSSKGLRLSPTWILQSVQDEQDKRIYQDIHSRVFNADFRRLNDAVREFVLVYGESTDKYWPYFLALTKLKNLKSGFLETPEKMLQKIIKELSYQRFENNLTAHYAGTSIDINSMDGFDFERFLSSLYGNRGFAVEHTKLSGDQGADLVLRKFNEITVVQAKRYSSPVGNKAVQEAIAARSFYKADRAIVVTNNRFTPSAQELARSANVELVDGPALAAMMDEQI